MQSEHSLYLKYPRFSYAPFLFISFEPDVFYSADSHRVFSSLRANFQVRCNVLTSNRFC
jgi:hypothetical protein